MRARPPPRSRLDRRRPFRRDSRRRSMLDAASRAGRGHPRQRVFVSWVDPRKDFVRRPGETNYPGSGAQLDAKDPGMFSKDLENAFGHVAIPLVLALTLAAAGCSAGGSPADPHAGSDTPNPFIEVAPAGAAAQAWGSPVPGHLVFRPRGVTAVASAVDARLIAVDSHVGATVNAGDPLFTLQSGEAGKIRAERAAAEAKAAAADDVLRRQNELVARGVGLEVARFAAETEAREAHAELVRARGAAELLGPGEGDRFVL